LLLRLSNCASVGKKNFDNNYQDARYVCENHAENVCENHAENVCEQGAEKGVWA
jgi:hypothetical protein